MEVKEIKQHLHDVIDRIDDVDLLNEIDDFIAEVTTEEVPLTDLQKKAMEKSIEKGLDDIKNGRVTPHEEVMKKFRRWRSK